MVRTARPSSRRSIGSRPRAPKRGSRFYHKVDVEHVAAMGMSCGGLMAYGASDDPRVATVGIWNSGLLPNTDDKGNAKIYAGIHGSVIIVTGGESDIAYANGKRDFEAHAREHSGVLRRVSIGRPRRHLQPGQRRAFRRRRRRLAQVAAEGDTSATGRGYFVGDDCGICKDSNWKTDSRSLR